MIRALGILVVALTTGAHASEIASHLPDDVREIAAETLDDDRLADLAATCPDALWQDRSISLGGLLNDCETPGGCRRQCNWGSGEACFDLARIMQDLEPDMPSAVSERWFAKACANGHAGGCTNRAAGILVQERDDPFSERLLEEATTCAARSFALSCAAEDAWGCAMHSRDLRDGVLGPPDADAARTAAQTACALEGAYPVGACDAARRWVLD